MGAADLVARSRFGAVRAGTDAAQRPAGEVAISRSHLAIPDGGSRSPAPLRSVTPGVPDRRGTQGAFSGGIERLGYPSVIRLSGIPGEK